ncbi:hypothetical protein [Tellurirhabdus bombi]|uniref:hypothetical protein n=1 Tax=Tellurirhabdus bombi TaxID=2907205 RepID=UPI001F28B1EA|nr:hypothetical protein [Tellurirhabdus bombi]
MSCLLLLMGIFWGFGRLQAQTPPDAFWQNTMPRTQAQVDSYIYQLTVIGALPSLQTDAIGNYNSQQQNTNEVNTRVAGSNNQVVLLLSGDYNGVELDLTGDNNAYNLIQSGEQNLISLPNIQTNNAQLTIIQQGVENTIRQDSYALTNGGVPMIIEQRGGAEIYIRNGN